MTATYMQRRVFHIARMPSIRSSHRGSYSPEDVREQRKLVCEDLRDLKPTGWFDRGRDDSYEYAMWWKHALGAIDLRLG